MNTHYVHGYTDREAERLHDQAGAVRDLIHGDTHYPAGSLVLEAPCGVGSQTVTLARNSPEARFVALDRSIESIREARALIAQYGITNVRFEQADVFRPPFPDATFDHLFVCFLLEHLADPVGALRALSATVRPGGSVTVFEGDHGSWYFAPETSAARAVWQCLITVQARLGGDALIGRRLYSVLKQAGLGAITVSPRLVYADAGQPATMDRFVLRTIVPMVEGVRESALRQGLIDDGTWRQGLADLRAIASRPDGAFCYTFFKATSLVHGAERRVPR